MRTAKRAFILASVLILPQGVEGQGIWKTFLSAPDSQGVESVAREFRTTACTDVTMPGSADKSNLFRLTASGNPFAFEAATIIYRCLGGGDAGDFERSAGQFFELKPTCFLKLAGKRELPPAIITNAIVNLPLETVDDTSSIALTIDRRLRILKSLHGESLLSAKSLLERMRASVTTRTPQLM